MQTKMPIILSSSKDILCIEKVQALVMKLGFYCTCVHTNGAVLVNKMNARGLSCLVIVRSYLPERMNSGVRTRTELETL
jgi:hypothetical protein